MLLRLLLNSLFFFATFVGAAQTPNDCWKLAQGFQEQGNYKAAEKLYQRILYFDTAHAFSKVNLELANLAIAEGKATLASSYLQSYRVQLPMGSDDWLETSFKIATLSLQENLPLEALGELLQLKTLFLDGLQKQRLSLYLAAAYFQNKQFIESEKYFLSITNSSDHKMIKAIFKKNNRLEKVYNSFFLQVMSALLPGSGQLYSGYYKESVNSVLIVGSFVVLFSKMTRIYGWLDAFLSVYPWLSRYHQGGVRKVDLLANERIKQKRSMYYNKLMKQLT
jgi:hypothetical protein